MDSPGRLPQFLRAELYGVTGSHENVTWIICLVIFIGTRVMENTEILPNLLPLTHRS